MVPEPAFACERLRQASGVSLTHNRKTLVLLLNRFSLLPSWFKEGWGDDQTQHIALPTHQQPNTHSTRQKKKSPKHINADAVRRMCNRDDSFCSASLIKLKVAVTAEERAPNCVFKSAHI